MPGLGASFGRGAATTFQQDLARSDCVLIMGSNMAEAHPVAFRWPMRAKERGAPLIHVDPRFSRTSALCDVHVPIRAGTDIAFLGGLINYVLTHELWFEDYVKAYTNASTLVEEGYEDAEDADGVFSGFDPETKLYDGAKGKWSYESPESAEEGDGEGDADGEGESEEDEKLGMHGEQIMGGFRHHHSPRGSLTEAPAGEATKDPTLRHPRCVMQILRRHYARYTPEKVAEICGCEPEQVVRVARLLAENSGRERTSAIVYAVGWTQHTTGVQMIRAAGILQLLLGNVGRPGGGVMALRGHASIQGSTDVATLYDLLPGYLPLPYARKGHDSLESYVEHEGLPTGYWANTSKLIVSQLKAFYGDAARPENDFRYDWLPRFDADYSHMPFFDRMRKGEVKGYFLFGQNPAGGAPNAKLHRAGLRALDWLVVLDWFEIESATFWRDDPTGPPPEEVATEVFFLPVAAIPEKEGTFTNTDRLLQWHDKAIDSPGDCRTDAWYVYQLGKRLKQLYADSKDPKDAPLLALTWDYESDDPKGEPDLEKVLKEMNGYDLKKGALLGSFEGLKDDGSTSSGCWIYCGVFPEEGRNRAKDRGRSDGPVPRDWGFVWPSNRRVLYNRASADPEGRPWSERKKLVWWSAAEGRWTGDDTPDFEPEKRPDYRPHHGARGMDAIAGDQPFIMKPDGRGWLFAPGGLRDGPLPTHYEPAESPVPNALYPKQHVDPTNRNFESELNPLAHTPTADYPVVACTFRLTEHYLSGPMSRFNSWLNELMPEMFVELSPELAAAEGIEHGGWVTVTTPRASIAARAMVTRRLRPLTVQGRTVHQIGIPFHWGYAGETPGAIANDLTSLVAEPNVTIHEGKVFACRVRAGHSGQAPGAPVKPMAPWPSRERLPGTPSSAQPEGHMRLNP